MVFDACRFLRLIALAAVFAPLMFLSSAMAADLALYMAKQGKAIHIRAVSPFDTSEYTIGSQTGIVQKLEQIYDLIERRPEAAGTMDKVGDFMGKQYQTVRGLIPFWKDEKENAGMPDAPPEVEALNRLLGEAGGMLFDPIAPMVASASQIDFVVAEDCLFYPFDVLHVGGIPLFLKKPVSYSLSTKKTAAPKASASWRGLIISDAETDPEKGAATVTDSFPGAFGFDTNSIRREDIAGISAADFILISADGGVDGLKMNHLVLRPDTLSRLQPELVYFDCNLYGLNLNFINHFNHSGVRTYVAPIFSLQTGDASSETMVRFFRTLLYGECPSRAMYLTRKTLYDSCIFDGQDVLTATRSAFPFRVYHLN
jgi:hypothetical protein